MKATIKGFNFKLEVSATIKCDEYNEINNRHDSNCNRDFNYSFKGLDLNVNVGLGTAAESYEGEVNLGELIDGINLMVKDSIKQQINEQVSELKEDLNNKADEAIKEVKEDQYNFKQEVRESINK